MVSGCWSLNWNLGLHDYKAAQANPDILLRREPEWQDGYSIARQVKGKARFEQCNSSVPGRAHLRGRIPLSPVGGQWPPFCPPHP